MKKVLMVICTGLTLATSGVNAQWGMPGSSNMMPGSSNMMPWGGGQSYQQPQYQQPSFSGMMPWGGSRAPAYQAPPQQPFGGMMPWGNSAPAYRAPQQQPFGGMMPFGGMSQPQYQQPQSNFMMPGMDQGIRSMMQPGRIMAEEATPGMYMKPTWR